MSEDERQIRHVIETWMEKSKAGDTAAVLELMTDDVVFLTAGRTFGKEEFAKGMESMKGMTFEGSSDIQEIEIAEDWAFVRSELTVKVTTPDGKETTRTGPALSIFRRSVDRNWQLARDANLLE
jgi:uncharacterized protein (TIGR02246 family)